MNGFRFLGKTGLLSCVESCIFPVYSVGLSEGDSVIMTIEVSTNGATIMSATNFSGYVGYS